MVGGRLHVSLRVTPRAARDELILEGGELRARLHAPPVEGAANAALLALLAARLHVPKTALELVRGATARQKVVAIAGLSPDDLWGRLGW
jgi:uncharacterized protein YggU (UPF0235/DUF167 family)